MEVNEIRRRITLVDTIQLWLELKMKQVTLLSLMLLSSMLNQAQESENSAPVVTNVIVVKVDFERVLIRFDVEDTEGDKSKI